MISAWKLNKLLIRKRNRHIIGLNKGQRSACSYGGIVRTHKHIANGCLVSVLVTALFFSSCFVLYLGSDHNCLINLSFFMHILLGNQHLSQCFCAPHAANCCDVFNTCTWFVGWGRKKSVMSIGWSAIGLVWNWFSGNWQLFIAGAVHGGRWIGWSFDFSSESNQQMVREKTWREREKLIEFVLTFDYCWIFSLTQLNETVIHYRPIHSAPSYLWRFDEVLY